MSRHLLVCLSACLIMGCASGMSGPTYEFRPDGGPLRYEVTVYQSLLVETPVGTQRSEDTVSAIISLEIGGPSGDGLSVSASFEALTVRSVGDMGTTRLEGGELIGAPISGLLAKNGSISVSERPSVSARLADVFDATSMLAELLVPLPEDGITEQPWPVRLVVLSETSFTLTSTFEGTARLVGDTMWNGVLAKIIVADGTVTVEGGGQPAGAPAPVTMSITGSNNARYVWDAQRGVMLASETDYDLAGAMTMEGFDMAFQTTASGRQTVELKR